MGSIEEAKGVDEISEGLVQEIVKKDPSLIPQKYLRSEEDRAKDVDMSLQYTSQIPILDLTLLSNGDTLELQKLDKACQEWGFFQVINHGIAREVVESLKNGATGFFKLSLEEKRKYPYDSVTVQGYGMHYPVPEDQKLEWSDALVFLLYPSHLRKNELWPEAPPSFKDAVEAYAGGVKKVSERILGSLSLIMGMGKKEENALLGLHKEMAITMRVNYYPTCSKPDQVLGLSPHSDSSSITILLQDDHLTGLQIRHHGGWVTVKPVPGSLVVNIGDVVEMWSNGKYKSVEHRAVVASERISYASFIMPHVDQEIEPLEEMLLSNGKNEEKKYQKIRYGDYVKNALKQKSDGKKHLEKYKA